MKFLILLLPLISSAGPFVSGGADRICRNDGGSFEIHLSSGSDGHVAIDGQVRELLPRKSRFTGAVYTAQARDGSVLVRRPLEEDREEVTLVTVDFTRTETLTCY